MLDVNSYPIQNNDVMLATLTVTTTKTSLGDLLVAAGISPKALRVGIFLRHLAVSAVDDLLVYNDSVSETNYFDLPKECCIDLPVTSVDNISVKTSSGLATFVLKAY